MEARAPYGLPPASEPRPRNLAPELRPALLRLGFVVHSEEGPTQTLLVAEWHDPAGPTCYHLLYTHFHPPGSGQPPLSYVSLALLHPGQPTTCLVADTHVRKVAEVRLLLLGNVRYKAARQAALDAGTLLSAAQHPVA